MNAGVDLPKLLHSDAEFLRLAIFVEAELRDQLLGERTPRALGDERIFAAKLDAPRKSALEASVAGNSHVSSRYAQNRAGVAIEDLGAGETRKISTPKASAFAPKKRTTLPSEPIKLP